MSTDSNGSNDGDGNEEFERLVQAVKRELQDDGIGTGKIGRRTVLGAIATAGIGGGIIGSSGTARAAGEDFSNASGTVGTDSQPLSEINSTRGHFQSLTSTDISGNVAGGDTITNLSGNIYVQSTQPTAQNEGDIWIDTS